MFYGISKTYYFECFFYNLKTIQFGTFLPLLKRKIKYSYSGIRIRIRNYLNFLFGILSFEIKMSSIISLLLVKKKWKQLPKLLKEFMVLYGICKLKISLMEVLFLHAKKNKIK